MRASSRNSITTAPESPLKDRRRRMIEYSIMMGLRIICIVTVFLVPGWWRLVPVAGAVLLPYFAVVIANVTSQRVDPPKSVSPYELTAESSVKQ